MPQGSTRMVGGDVTNERALRARGPSGCTRGRIDAWRACRQACLEYAEFPASRGPKLDQRIVDVAAQLARLRAALDQCTHAAFPTLMYFGTTRRSLVG